MIPTDPVTLATYAGLAVVALLLARGLWILKRSGDARIERKKAAVKAREGRRGEDALTYDQEVEAEAIAKLSRIPLVGRIIGKFDSKK